MKSRHQSPPAISGTMVRLAMSRALMLIVKVSVDSSLFVCLIVSRAQIWFVFGVFSRQQTLNTNRGRMLRIVMYVSGM